MLSALVLSNENQTCRGREAPASLGGGGCHMKIYIRGFTKEFDDICVEYFRWLSNELSQIGLITKSKIYNKLNELLS